MRHREISNYLEYSKGIHFEEECVYIKQETPLKMRDLNVKVPTCTKDRQKESTSLDNSDSNISTLTISTLLSKRQRQKYDTNRIIIPIEIYDDLMEYKKIVDKINTIINK